MSDTPRIRLYTYAMSPFAAKVHGFLLYKQLDFECFYIHPLRVKQDLPVGRQIPVLTIDGESRNDSTPIGLWLDERFPDTPRLLPADGPERERLLAMDAWVTNRLIPSTFRFVPGDGLDLFRNGWRLSHVMSRTAHGGLSAVLRAGWPLLIRSVPFVQRLRAQADDGLPLAESKRKLYAEFVDCLEGGAFLGGRSTPSMPDLAAYPQFALAWMVGMRGSEDFREFPEIVAWLARMRPYVDGTPPLLPAVVRERELPGA